MDKFLLSLVDADTPKLNPAIAEGLACTYLPFCEEWVDQIFRSAAKGFPEGLVYLGYRRCLPNEEFNETTKRKGTKRTFDVAVSQIYMVKYHFRFGDEDLPPRYLYLPYVLDGGSIKLGGSQFNISPLLIDRVISVGTTNIFVRLLRDRLTFERIQQHYMVDGQRETVQVAWSLIYHKNQKAKRIKATVKAHTTMMHYLFCKYGFKDTFLKFGNCRPVVGGPEINTTTYPENEWVICSSTGVKPKGLGRVASYKGSELVIAIRKEEYESQMVKNMIGGFFYILDHFPERILPEYITGTNTERGLWMTLMGIILFSGNIGEGKLRDDIKDHIDSLDEYVDGIVIKKLEDIGSPITDVYQLFAVIIKNYNDWLLNASDKVSSMYDKELSVLYHVLYEISSAIFKLMFKLKAASKNKKLTSKEIIATFNATLRTGLIYSITKGHGEVSTVSCPGDNKAFKTTAILVPQGSSNKTNNRKDRAVINDPAKRLHASVAEVGGFSNLPKSEPSGRSRINPYLQFDSKGVVQRDPQFVPLLDEIQEMIRRN